MATRAVRAVLGAAGALLLVRPAAAATRAEVLELAVKAADRLASLKTFDRGWEDAVYLDGLLLVAEELEKDAPGSGEGLRARALAVLGSGTSPVSRGDDCGYAMAALDAARTAPEGSERAALVAATDAPLAFARDALRRDASDGPPRTPWWTASGYGPRYWQDDVYTLVPFLAMRGSGRDGLAGDDLARDLAYEWIEAYASDHRKALGGSGDADVPELFATRGAFLRDARTGLFFHDASTVGSGSFWGRGNGWVALGLTRAQRYLDRPYGGSRYAHVPDRHQLRAWLSRMAATLAHERNGSGTWNADILRRDLITRPETSGSALFTFFLATGVDEGWLDRAYVPVVLQAFGSLMREVDGDGDVLDIQRTGTGPDSVFLSSDDPSSNSDFGVGAFLLAAAAVSRLPAGELARLESVGEADAPARRTFFFAEETVEVAASNPGAAKVTLEVARGAAAARRSVGLAAGGSVVLRDSRTNGGLLVIRADGDVSLAGFEAGEPEDPPVEDALARRRFPSRRRGDEVAPVELSDGLLEAETALVDLAPVGEIRLLNLSFIEARARLELFDGKGAPLGVIALDVPAFGEARTSAPAAASARLTNETRGAALAPSSR